MTLFLQFDSLVVDSGAIIKGHGYSFHKKAKVFYTTEGVINEIKDSKSRELLANLPFELIVRNPSHTSLKAVVDFSKKSGDYASLSKTDIYVLALTYMLEVEAKGTSDNIRKEPVKHSDRRNGLDNAGVKKNVKSKIITTDKLWDDANTFNCDCAHLSSQEEELPDLDIDNISHEISETNSEVSNISNNNSNIIINSRLFEDDQLKKTPCPADQLQMDDQSTSTEHPASTTQTQKETETEDNKDVIEEITDKISTIDLLLPVPPPATAKATTKPKFSWAQIASAPPAIVPISTSTPASHTISTDPTPALTPLVTENTTLNTEPEKEGQVVEEEDISSHTSSTTTTTIPTTSTSSNNKNIPHSRILTGGVALGATSSNSSKIAQEDDGLNWVTPQNIHACRASGKGMFGSESQLSESPNAVDSSSKVACMTTDYSMQNVLLQMGLAVCSVDGMLVRQLRSWVKQCSACFTMHHDMDKLFCTRCGGTTLQRIATSVDANTGELKFHLRKNYHYNARGTKYSLPKPGQQGKFEGELLLREDQLLAGIWRQKVAKGKKELSSAFGEDIAVDVGIHINKSTAIKIGLGRRNPNSDKGRKSRGKK